MPQAGKLGYYWGSSPLTWRQEPQWCNVLMILPSTASPILEIDTNRSHTYRPTSMMAMMMTMTITTTMGMITMMTMMTMLFRRLRWLQSSCKLILIVWPTSPATTNPLLIVLSSYWLSLFTARLYFGIVYDRPCSSREIRSNHRKFHKTDTISSLNWEITFKTFLALIWFQLAYM